VFISIIVVSYNRLKLTKYCIESLIANTPREEFELIVVDNCSTDGTVEYLQNLKEIDNLVLNDKNYYLGRAFNQGINRAKGEWILTLANDRFAMSGWIDNFKKVVDELNPDVIWTLLVEGYTRSKKVTLNNKGTILYPYKRYYARGLAMKADIRLKYAVKVPNHKTPGPSSNIYKQVLKHKLKMTYLYKPCLLLQYEEFSNPEFADYYNTLFKLKGKIDIFEKFKQLEMCEKVKNLGRNSNIVDYYSGTNHYKNKVKRFNEQS